MKRKTVKELEQLLQEQVDGTSDLVKDCNLWREKYQKLVEENKVLRKQTSEMTRVISSSKGEAEKLKTEIEILVEENKKLKSQSIVSFLKGKLKSCAL